MFEKIPGCRHSSYIFIGDFIYNVFFSYSFDLMFYIKSGMITQISEKKYYFDFFFRKVKKQKHVLNSFAFNTVLFIHFFTYKRKEMTVILIVFKIEEICPNPFSRIHFGCSTVCMWLIL